MSRKSVLLLIAIVSLGVAVAVYAAKEIPWDEAGRYYGQEATVAGKIVATHNSGKACFLNFHQNWKRYFTAVIFASDFQKFPPNPEDYYLNKQVKIMGVVKEYKGKPEIILRNPGQIVILEKAYKIDSAASKPVSLSLQAQISALESNVQELGKRVRMLEDKVERLEKFLEPQPLSTK